MNADTVHLSPQGREMLRDPLLFELLSVIAASVGASPREYLIRFEEVLAEDPRAIFGIFEGYGKKQGAV